MNPLSAFFIFFAVVIFIIVISSKNDMADNLMQNDKKLMTKVSDIEGQIKDMMARLEKQERKLNNLKVMMSASKFRSK